MRLLIMPLVTQIIVTAIIAIVVFIVAFLLGITYRKKVSEREIQSAEEKAKRIINDSIKAAESKKREALLEAKEEIHKSRNDWNGRSVNGGPNSRNRSAGSSKRKKRSTRRRMRWKRKRKTLTENWPILKKPMTKSPRSNAANLKCSRKSRGTRWKRRKRI